MLFRLVAKPVLWPEWGRHRILTTRHFFQLLRGLGGTGAKG